MAAVPFNARRLPSAVRLEPFDPRLADRVVEWVRTPLDAYWLAPQTPPPLTVEKIVGWFGEGRRPFQLVDAATNALLGYGELNELSLKPGEFWLGHLIVDPGRRGCGVGRELVRRLLGRAFSRMGATRVTLVVFPENAPAIACYRSAGMIEDGYEVHHFAAYGTTAALLRMTAAAR